MMPHASRLTPHASALQASIIVPCYNQSHYLHDAIDSLLAQTEARWEAVIVDDGSTDDTPALAQEQASRDPRISVLTQRNRGLGAARNAGIAATKAPAVLCLDADDMITPTFLERTLAALEHDRQIGFVSSNVQFFGDEQNAWSGGAPTAERLRWDCRLVSASLFRRAAWQEAGGFAERDAMPSYEDWDFWLRLVEHGWRGAHIPEPLVFVRRVRGGMLHDTQRDDLVLRARLVARHQSLFPLAFGPWASSVLREAGRRGDGLLWWRWFGWYAALVAFHAPRELPKALLRPAMKRLAPGQQMYARRVGRLLGLSKAKALRKPTLKPLKRLYRQFLRGRARGLHDEVAFWDAWFATKGLDWPDEYQRRLDPTTVLLPHLQRFIAHIHADDISILDVGAGPLTILGKQLPGKRLSITATDVLAPAYDELLRVHNIEPLVRTVFADAEQLSRHYAPNSFDLIIAQNTLDHMKNPWKALQQMIAIAKPGCYVVLEHREKEAEYEDYAGLHQWNLSYENGAFIMQNVRQRIDVSQALRTQAIITCTVENTWLQVAIKKL